MAVAVAEAGSCSSSLNPSLGTSVFCGCGPKKPNKNNDYPRLVNAGMGVGPGCGKAEKSTPVVAVRENFSEEVNLGGYTGRYVQGKEGEKDSAVYSKVPGEVCCGRSAGPRRVCVCVCVCVYMHVSWESRRRGPGKRGAGWAGSGRGLVCHAKELGVYPQSHRELLKGVLSRGAP